MRIYRVLDVKLRGQQINEGDTVKVKPAPGRRDGFDAKFLSADVDGEGHIYLINVFGGRGERKTVRSYLPERIVTYRKQKESS